MLVEFVRDSAFNDSAFNLSALTQTGRDSMSQKLKILNAQPAHGVVSEAAFPDTASRRPLVTPLCRIIAPSCF